MSEKEGFIIPSDPESRKKIADVFKDVSNQLIKAESVKDYAKEAKKALKEEFDIPISVINKLFKIYHENAASAYFEGQRDLEEAYEMIFPENK